MNPMRGAELAEGYAESFELNALFLVPLVDTPTAAVHARALRGRKAVQLPM